MRGAALALSLLFLFGCSSRLVPTSADSVSLERQHDDPARDAQLTLLREAHRAFVQARYPTAVLFFRRYVDSAAPGTPRLAEARWWLGRSYEQAGNFPAAVAEYRILATAESGSGAPGELYQTHALRRLDELRQSPGGSQAAGVRQVAVGLTLSQLPAMSEWVAWLQVLVKGGVRTILLDQTNDERVEDPVAAPMPGFIQAAHLAGLSVWGSVDLHQGRGLSLRPEWLSQSLTAKGIVLNGHGATVAETEFPDPVHPDYQAAVEDRVKQLLRAGCDGIVLKGRGKPGYAQDFSSGSFQRFASSFGLTMAPSQLFGRSGVAEGLIQDREALYWRWVGWKARGYAGAAARIRRSIREANPAGRLLVEVHGRTVREPLWGLEQYGEDLIDLYQRAVAELVVHGEPSEASALLESVAQLVGSSDRLWLVRPVAVLEKSTVAEWAVGIESVLQEPGSENIVILPQGMAGLP